MNAEPLLSRPNESAIVRPLKERDVPVRGSWSRHSIWAAPAALVFLLYSAFWSSAPILTTDSPGYMRLARDIRHLRISEFHQRTPGYPLMLVLTGATEHPTRALFYSSLVAQFGAVYLLVRLLLWCGVRPRWARAFGLLAILPPFVEPAAYVMTETLTTLALTAAYAALVVALERAKVRHWAVFAALALMCALVRPTFALLVPALIIVVAGCRLAGIVAPRWSSLVLPFGAVTVLVAAVFGGMSAINYRRFGMFASTSLGPIQLSTKVTSVLEFLPDQYAGLRELLIHHRDENLIQRFDDHMAQDYIYRAWPDVKRYYGGSETRALEAVQNASTYLILHKPGSYLGDCARLIGQFWMPMDVPLASGRSVTLRAVWFCLQLLICSMFFVELAIVGGLLCFLLAVRRNDVVSQHILEENRRPVLAYVIGVAIVVYNMVLSCFLGIGLARYRVPTDLAILGTVMMGITIWSNAVAGYRRRAL